MNSHIHSFRTGRLGLRVGPSLPRSVRQVTLWMSSFLGVPPTLLNTVAFAKPLGSPYGGRVYSVVPSPSYRFTRPFVFGFGHISAPSCRFTVRKAFGRPLNNAPYTRVRPFYFRTVLPSSAILHCLTTVGACFCVTVASGERIRTARNHLENLEIRFYRMASQCFKFE